MYYNTEVQIIAIAISSIIAENLAENRIYSYLHLV